MSFNYNVYGLKISSSRSISILTETDNNKTDLYVTWANGCANVPGPALAWTPVITNELTKRPLINFFTADSADGVFYKIHFDTGYGGITFLLDPTKTKLCVTHSANEPEGNVNSYFVGSILGCILRLKGQLCLHASVVNLKGKAVLFLGDKRTGKSTTAAFFAKLGYKVLSDDIAAVSFQDNLVYVAPGYSKIRLRPASLAVLHHQDPDYFPSVYTERDSRYTDIAESFYNGPLPIEAIYVLTRNDLYQNKPVIEPVYNEAAFLLNNNTFANYLITKDMRKLEFECVTKLALRVPVYRLIFGSNINLVSLQCEAVINNAKVK